MSELIKRQDAINAVAQLYKYESDRMTALQEVPVITEQEIRNKAIDEFAERLRTDYVNFDLYYILQDNNFAFENTSLKSYKDMIDEIAAQMKGGE